MFSMIEAKNIINIPGVGNRVTVLDRIVKLGPSFDFQVSFNKLPNF